MTTHLEHRNPAAKLFPDGYETWQILILREALNQYKFQDAKKKSDETIARAISSQTNIEVHREAVRRFLANYYGYDSNGPLLPFLHAVASFLSHDRIRCLNIANLQRPIETKYPPIELLPYISDLNNLSGFDDESLSANYERKVRDGHIVSLCLRRSKEMRHFIVSEKTSLTQVDKSGRSIESSRESVGWFLPSVSGPLILLKDTQFGRFTLKIALGDFRAGFPGELHILKHRSPLPDPRACLKGHMEQFVRLES